MEAKKVMDLINEFVDNDGVIDKEGLEAKLNEKGNNTKGNQDDKNEDITIEDISKMTPEELRENTEAVKIVLSNLSQDEINEHWEAIQKALKGLK